jgi:hypothetical protein
MVTVTIILINSNSSGKRDLVLKIIRHLHARATALIFWGGAVFIGSFLSVICLPYTCDRYCGLMIMQFERRQD